MNSRLVTIGRFDDPTTANFMLGRLEASGIEADLRDEATVGLAWHLNTAMGGIRLQVKSEDEEQARLLLADHQEMDIEAVGAGEDGDFETTETGPREATARRAFLAGIIGLALSPLLVYSLVLAVRVATAKGELSKGAQFKVGLIGLVDVLGIAFAVWFFMNLG